MYKIAVIGDRDSVLGFKALGLDVFPIESPDEARKKIHVLAGELYAIIYLTEQLAVEIPDAIAQYKDELTPAIIFIPGREGTLGIGISNLKSAVERAVGVDILS